jgi:hypothetical protein
MNTQRPGLSTGPEGEIMRARHNRILFAGSGLGIPSLEEAIERGLLAAKNMHALFYEDRQRDIKSKVTTSHPHTLRKVGNQQSC